MLGVHVFKHMWTIWDVHIRSLLSWHQWIIWLVRIKGLNYLCKPRVKDSLCNSFKEKFCIYSIGYLLVLKYCMEHSSGKQKGKRCLRNLLRILLFSRKWAKYFDTKKNCNANDNWVKYICYLWWIWNYTPWKWEFITWLISFLFPYITCLSIWK